MLAVGKDQTTDARIRYAFRLALAREPYGEERACLAELLADELAESAMNPDEAAARAAGPVPAYRNPRLLNAWTTVSRALLNLDEFMTRE